MPTLQEKLAVEARRTRVSEGVTARKGYRVMAEEEGVALGTIAADVKWLRKEWAKERGNNTAVLEQALRDLDAWQGQLMDDLLALPPEKRSSAIDTLIRLNDQRLKSLGLYPKQGLTAEDYPTGPITIQLEVIESGNRKLLADPLDDELAVETGHRIINMSHAPGWAPEDSDDNQV